MRLLWSRLRDYGIWYIASTVWLLDAALALHFDHLTHAMRSVGVALMFLVAGALWRRASRRLP